jgi:hypothetical protein
VVKDRKDLFEQLHELSGQPLVVGVLPNVAMETFWLGYFVSMSSVFLTV